VLHTGTLTTDGLDTEGLHTEDLGPVTVAVAGTDRSGQVRLEVM